MAHNDSDDKVDLAGEGLSADSQEPAAIEAANENAALRDRLLRALAEVENTRRRAERSVVDAREYGISDFAAELLSVVDNLQRAVASAEDRTDQTPADAALLDGVRATQRQLLATLGRFGVKRIEARGVSLDPNLHEAMAEVEDNSRPLKSVVSVLEDGCRLRRPRRRSLDTAARRHCRGRGRLRPERRDPEAAVRARRERPRHRRNRRQDRSRGQCLDHVRRRLPRRRR